MEPGHTVCLAEDVLLWTVGGGDGERVCKAQLSRRQGLQESRAKAELSDDKAGIIQGANGANILSVRLSDRCDRDPEQHVTKPCGHVFCPRCNGYVCPRIKVALRSPGPIVTCNRPRSMKDFVRRVGGCGGARPYGVLS